MTDRNHTSDIHQTTTAPPDHGSISNPATAPTPDRHIPGIDRHPAAAVAASARFDIGSGGRVIIHEGAQIRDNAHFEAHDEGVVTIGRNAVVGVNNWIQGNGDVDIGELTCLGPNVVVLSTTHQMDLARPIQHQPLSKKKTTIGRDVWIGANSTIAAGVTIGDQAVIGANSFVNHDVAPRAIAHGSPAREKGQRTVTPKRLTLVFPVAVGFEDRPSRCHAVARFFATMGNTLSEIGVESWHICHPLAASGLDRVRGDRKYIRADHSDFGDLLDRIQPDVMFLWNGATPAHNITRRFAAERNIPIRCAELGWFPQSTTMYFDLKGTNARSSIRDLDLANTAVHPKLDQWLARWRTEMLVRDGWGADRPPIAPNNYVFVPLQDERDVNITLASPYPTMDAFVTALAKRFPNEQFVVRPHPHFRDVKLTPRANVHVTSEGSLHAWISHAEAVVGINSTALLESLAWDRPTHSVGAGIATGLNAIHDFNSVDDLTIHREITHDRRDRIRRFLSELIFVRQFRRKDLHYLEPLRHAHGIADLLENPVGRTANGKANNDESERKISHMAKESPGQTLTGAGSR